MSCVSAKASYPDLQTALIVRDALIQRYGRAILAYKCRCQMWHLTTYPPNGRISTKKRKWNNLFSLEQQTQYADMVSEARIRVEDNLPLLYRASSRR